MLIVPLASGLLGLVVVCLLFFSIKREDVGKKRMGEIASYVREGAKAFLRREFKTIAFFILIFVFILYSILGWQISLGFLTGSLFSLLAAYVGMAAACEANVRVANAARRRAGRAFAIAFRGGGVTGLTIVSLSLLSLTLLFYLFGRPSLLVGFGFGASMAALFAQLGGGIYTKAADIGADLVGKVEKRIPEDDPRNPAVIADLVGDNVGDCAGRGADLFESFSDNIIGAMILGVAFLTAYGSKAILFPLLASSIGVLATIVSLTLLRDWKNTFLGINLHLLVVGFICAIGFYALTVWYMGNLNLFYCAILGLSASLLVTLVIQHYTSVSRQPVYQIAKSAKSGPAVSVIMGLSYGLESAVMPVLIVAVVILLSYLLGGSYGIVTATLGILSTTGIIMSSDTFGPIVDNADGIAEMSGIADEVGEVTEALDAAGNMTKAITKGYAMSCALLSALVLLFAYLSEASLATINLANPTVLVGLFLGASIPFVFSAFAIRSVGRIAHEVVGEVRRQFKQIRGLLAGKAKPDYSKCVDIATKSSLKEMVLPTLISVCSTVLVGFLLGVEALGAFLAGLTISGALLAVFMFNAGGALDNAKKFVEAGNFGGKGTRTHAASVVGDTVGDPLKDTAGPSLHILIKLGNIIAITLLPLFLQHALV